MPKLELLNSVLLYNGLLLCGFNVPIKGLTITVESGNQEISDSVPSHCHFTIWPLVITSGQIVKSEQRERFSLPSPFYLPPIPYSVPLPLPSFPLEVGPINPARGLEERYKLPDEIEFSAFGLKIWHLVATSLIILLRINWPNLVHCMITKNSNYSPRPLQITECMI